MTRLAQAAVRAVRFYQRRVSAGRPPVCRYVPTCSEYAVQALQRFGFFKGAALSLARVCRCNPLFKGGWDPVPEKKRKKEKRR